MKKRCTRWWVLMLLLIGSTPSLFGQFSAGSWWRNSILALAPSTDSATAASPVSLPLSAGEFFVARDSVAAIDSVALFAGFASATLAGDRRLGPAELEGLLVAISETFERQRLVYAPGLGQDCSGIFHRLKDSLAARLPLLGDTSVYAFPAFAEARSSRQIADWYYRRGELRIVEDARASRHLLSPGAVLFFGKPGQRYRQLDIERLTDRAHGYSRHGIITHVAVVVSVERDTAGQVVGYTMMHGRNRRVPASRSSSREVQSRFTKGLPPFGNWSRQWVAVGRLLKVES